MSIEKVREHLRSFGKDEAIREFATSSATVEQAANTIGVMPAQIAKTLSFRGEGEDAFLVVAAGDAKIDNKKFRHTFGLKARMLTPEEVLEQTGHEIGGVCPFGLVKKLDVFLDKSMQRFDSLFPACGSTNSAIELSPSEIYDFADGKAWVDVCKDWEAEEEEIPKDGTLG